MRILIELPLIIAVTITTALATYTWRRRSIAGAFPFFIMLVATCFWSLTTWLSLETIDLQGKILWTSISYIGILMIYPTAIILVLQYIHKIGWLSRPWIYGLAVEPVATLILIWTNPFHHLFWSSTQLDTVGPYLTLSVTYGPAFWIHAIYANLLLILVAILLINQLIHASQIYRGQFISIMAGSLIPWLVNLLFVFRITPLDTINLTPFVFAITSPFLSWGLFRYRFINLVPVAYDAIIGSMQEGIIVLDQVNRVVALNPTAETITGQPASTIIGLPSDQSFKSWPGLAEFIKSGAEIRTDVLLDERETSRFFDLNAASLSDSNGRKTGRFILIRDITHSKRSEASLKQRAEELSTLHATLLDITASRDLDTLLDTITERAIHLLGAHGGSLYMCDGMYRKVRCVVSHNNPRNSTGAVFDYEQGEAGIIAQTGLPLNITDYRIWPERIDYPNQEKSIIALLGVPLIWLGKVIGVIDVLDVVDKRRFTDDDLELLTMFANQAAIAIENARLFEDSQRRAEEAETLSLATSTVAATLQQDESIERILEQLARVVPYDSAAVQLLREGYLEIVGGRGWADKSKIVGTLFPIPGENPNTVVIETRRPYILEDTDGANMAYLGERSDRIRSWLGVPLIVHDRIIGMFAVDSETPNYFTQDHARLVSAFADQVAIAIENARLYQEARQAAERRAILHQASQEVVIAGLDPERIYTTIHQAAARLMATEAFAISIMNETTHMIDAVYLVDHKGRAPSVSIPAHRGLSGHVINTGKSLYIEDMLEKLDTIDSIRYGDKEEVRSILAVPMRLGDKVIGMLSTQSYQPKAYNPEDEHLLEMLASYAAIALENARLFGEVQKLAITDPLTGAYNRRQLFDLGQREFNRAHRFDRPFSVILLDIDRFKVVNDTYGHATGDLVLRILTQRIQEIIREIDVLGRYGGEEFVVLLPETNGTAALSVAERVRSQAGRMPIPTEHGDVIVTISIGLTEISADTPDFSAMVARADAAMYDAKKAGRDRVGVR
jgi:diguanylate cyclase (GGDEF)-like protein/PAS domain S-box-containing protein